MEEKRQAHPITPHTRRWSQKLATCLPVREEDLPDFGHFVCWNGMNYYQTAYFPDSRLRRGHNGYDFAVYLTERGVEILSSDPSLARVHLQDDESLIRVGLPVGTAVVSVADGVVNEVWLDDRFPYHNEIRIRHGTVGENRGSLTSEYLHVQPFSHIIEGVEVRLGEPIGTIVRPLTYMPHLHLSLYHLRDGYRRWHLADPKVLDSTLYRFTTFPQGSTFFSVRLKQ